uniref:Uncharacterized protein n=1 Tax=Hyaloperonospora arabidopsidis (strain Emoy2) TaxID=559515 RepID=M4BB25_HYAAE
MFERLVLDLPHVLRAMPREWRRQGSLHWQILFGKMEADKIKEFLAFAEKEVPELKGLIAQPKEETKKQKSEGVMRDDRRKRDGSDAVVERWEPGAKWRY